MVEDIQNGMDEVIKLHVDTIKEIGVTAEASGKLVNNLATLYGLRQKDEDREAKFDFEKEKLAYDNGRLDMDSRSKEAAIRNESDRLEFEREKFQCELAVKEEANQIEKEKLNGARADRMIKAGTAIISTAFNCWVTSNVMCLEETGVIGSFVAKKIFGSMIGKQKLE